jgi:hypothetical protein
MDHLEQAKFMLEHLDEYGDETHALRVAQVHALIAIAEKLAVEGESKP